MEHQRYLEIWNAVCPIMAERMNALVEALQKQLPDGFTISRPQAHTDSDEYKVTADIQTNGLVAVGMDFLLRDADMHEGEEGVGIALSLTGNGGLVLGGYFPNNYQPDVWTEDVDEAIRRVEGVSIDALVEHIIHGALKNPALLKDLAKAGA
ncbi:hypothetical protein ACOTHJ_13460 [Achromobacter xylosoxidans]|uniref:hypothetical protein n=1 Tax=Achromobacter anxifer TaxID=1287737 RepID=UPI00155C76DA|nr:hypothetical protein [Achromobacter anxifer]CAB5514695.1 hypothetical protein LMG26857_03754 [Achromobacter anxifer]